MTLITKDDVNACVNVLKQGGIVVHPSKSSYGIGVDASSPEAVRKVNDLKQRDTSKHYICLVSDLKMAQEYAELSEKEIKVIKNLMPGPITIVSRKKQGSPELLDKDYFRFRIACVDIVRNIVEKLGKPIISTSANISSQKPLYKIKDVIDMFDNRVDIIIDAGDLKEKPCSTVVRIEPFAIFRHGPISQIQIEIAMRK